MDFERIKADIQEISQIATSVPEAFQEKCFEVLLRALLGRTSSGDDGEQSDKGQEPPSHRLHLKPAIRAFMMRQGITEDELAQVVMPDEDGDVLFIRKPSGGKVATAQIEWSLLLALRSVIRGDGLEMDPREVRAMCDKEKCYDAGNFSTVYRRPSNAKLFKGPVRSDGEPQSLSAEGEKQLAGLIRQLATGAPV